MTTTQEALDEAREIGLKKLANIMLSCHERAVELAKVSLEAQYGESIFNKLDRLFETVQYDAIDPSWVVAWEECDGHIAHQLWIKLEDIFDDAKFYKRCEKVRNRRLEKEAETEAEKQAILEKELEREQKRKKLIKSLTPEQRELLNL